MALTESAFAEVIYEDLTCVRCAYNLRGLTTDKRCPECGTPIGRSIQGNRLRFADPAWLNKLRLGATVRLWCIPITMLLAGCLGLLGAGALSVPTVIVVGLALSLWATFLITTQEPLTAPQEDRVNLRTLIRVCAAGGFVAGFIESTTAASPGGTARELREGALGILALVAFLVNLSTCAV